MAEQCLTRANGVVQEAITEGQVRWLQSLNPGCSRLELLNLLELKFKRAGKPEPVPPGYMSFNEVRTAVARSNNDSKDTSPWVSPTRGFQTLNCDTRYPPDVTQQTHIVAVCGVSDIEMSPEGVNVSLQEGRGSPKQDGWMFSDFYLWLHLLSGLSKSEKWLTCEDPKHLLDRYIQGDKFNGMASGQSLTYKTRTQYSWAHGYLHGDPFEQRRVVLDHGNVDSIRAKLTQTNRGAVLRDTFLKELDKTCAQAAENAEPVLVMVFSWIHGRDPTRRLRRWH